MLHPIGHVGEIVEKDFISSTIISDEVVDVVVCRVGKWTWRDANHKINKVLSFKKKTKSISINPF